MHDTAKVKVSFVLVVSLIRQRLISLKDHLVKFSLNADEPLNLRVIERLQRLVIQLSPWAYFTHAISTTKGWAIFSFFDLFLGVSLPRAVIELKSLERFYSQELDEQYVDNDVVQSTVIRAV